MIFIEISGNIESLKKSTIAEIEALYDLEITGGDFLPQVLVESLAVLTNRINREIAVYINRKGNLTDINIGDSSTVTLSEVDGRRGTARLSGVRCIHTHPNGDGNLSPVDINSMLKLNLDAMAAIGVKDGEVCDIYVALPLADENGIRSKAEIYGPFKEGSESNYLSEIIEERDYINCETVNTGRESKEKAILVGLEKSSGRIISGKSEGERSLDELEELSLTAGLEVLEKVLQKRPVKDSAFFIGSGKIEQLCLMCQALNADTLVFDDELSGAQIRNIEAITGAKVVDRTTLILDIFAQRAHSSEGKLQVELAQLKYRLPRLMGIGGQLSRLGGGIGTRGPGEKKLETDRRHIRKRISTLESELKRIGKRRGLMREGRRQNSIPVVALVGYTNSGKSTLMNRLCNAEVFAEDKLFATLDTTTRKLMMPDGRQALLIDTVGFIRKLPHDLVEAFKSTLEEVVYADVLLHIVDVSDDEADEQIAVTEEILDSLGANHKPKLLVMNKIDLVNEIYPCSISAITGYGIKDLLLKIAEIIPSNEMEINICAPYSEGWVSSYLHENGKVKEEEYTEDGVKIKAVIKKDFLGDLKKYIIK